MLERPTLAALPTTQRVIVIDGSSIQGPGATGTHGRLHLCLELVTLALTQLLITDTHTGESLKDWRWAPGDVAVADRGYSYPEAMVQTVQAGADLLVRLNPPSVPLCQHDGTPLNLVAALKHQPQAILRSFPVVIGTPAGATREHGWVHAYRLAASEAANARAACRKRRRKKGRAPQQTTVYLAGRVLVWTLLLPTRLSAETILAALAVGALGAVRTGVGGAAASSHTATAACWGSHHPQDSSDTQTRSIQSQPQEKVE